ncbi:sugar-transfer associated ATP-grasp domain-containing protein [Desulfurispira natronophila]|uniref:Alpha-L-glutamate ligase-related protein ATP-grasp domain-containing protein n=1 Tax=Desulfurispira natronophila TaxID=682562 RepID=A0A7W7Y6F5_9BACT|nr:hypothetical protein [Desulfurispira natronophila]
MIRKLSEDKRNSDRIRSVYVKVANNIVASHGSGERCWEDYRERNRIYVWFVEDVLAGTIRSVRENGNYVKRKFGIGYLRQFLQVFYTSISAPALPKNYYRFEWYKKKRRKQYKDYLHRYEMKRIVYPALIEGIGVEKNALGDKRKFYTICRNNDIPVLDNLCYITKGKTVFEDGFDTEDLKVDLFIKPVSGKGGKGAAKFIFKRSENGALIYSPSNKGSEISFGEIVEKIQKKVLKKYPAGFVVQKCLRNSEELNGLSVNALITFRVITVLNESGDPVVVSGALRMTSDPRSDVDNVHAGGFASEVDLDTHCLTKAYYLGKGGSFKALKKHPVTGVSIKGKKIKSWSDMCDLATKAHRAMKPRIVVGWDIALSDVGPVLVEGNGQPCTDGPQRRSGRPLGTERFGELVAYHLENKI